MIHCLAQLTTEALPSFVTFVIGGSASVFLLNQVLTFYKSHMKEQPTPANTYATKDELRQAHGRMDREKREFDAAIRDLKAADIRISEKVEAEMKEFNERIDAVPARTIALLRETKGLIG